LPTTVVKVGIPEALSPREAFEKSKDWLGAQLVDGPDSVYAIKSPESGAPNPGAEMIRAAAKSPKTTGDNNNRFFDNEI